MATILIVDDELGIVEEVKAFFEDEGHRVYTADTGEDGIQFVEKIKPDVLLVDIKLPDLSGLRVLEASKRLSPKTKTIVITGYVDQCIIDEAEKLGRDAFLQKPFNFDVLQREVNRVLKIHHRTRPS